MIHCWKHYDGQRIVAYELYFSKVCPYIMQAYQNGSRQNWLSVDDIGVDGWVIWRLNIYMQMILHIETIPIIQVEH